MRTQTRLSAIRGLALDEELKQMREGLAVARKRRESMEGKLEKCLNQQAEWRDQAHIAEELEAAREAAAFKIQRIARGYIIRGYLRKTVHDSYTVFLLQQTRVNMTEKLLQLGRHLHELKFLDEDKHNAATKLEAWWRGILARRFCKVAWLHQQVESRQAGIEKCAIALQAFARGRVARLYYNRYLEDREKQRIKEEVEAALYTERCAVLIQSHVRRLAAHSEAEKRRRMLWKELEGLLEEVPKEAPAPVSRRRSSGGGGPKSASQKAARAAAMDHKDRTTM